MNIPITIDTLDDLRTVLILAKRQLDKEAAEWRESYARVWPEQSSALWHDTISGLEIVRDQMRIRAREYNRMLRIVRALPTSMNWPDDADEVISAPQGTTNVHKEGK